MMFSSEELKRYNRHIILPEVGLSGQEKLKKSKVLVVGAGGLGCPVLQYLTAAGVGTIGIIDFDKVDESNLQRQILFDSSDLGKLKAFVAAEKLTRQNPFIQIKVFPERLTSLNALEIFAGFDIIVDGSDNFPTRYLVNDACVILNKPLVFGSIFKFEGQVSVFNYKKGATYRCLFPDPPAAGDVPNCSEIGVLGVLPGIVGTFQANEVIKIILEVEGILSGKLFVLDALSMNQSIVTFSANPDNQNIQELIDYESFCGTEQKNDFLKIDSKEINVGQLKQFLDQKEDIFLLDVRESYEREICSIGGVLIPMNQLQENVDKIPHDKPVIVYCHHGMRSAMVVKFLSEEFGFNNLYNLEGGIHDWAVKIDPEMDTY